MKCEACKGKGFTEQFHGLLQLECGECMGSGKVEAVNVVEFVSIQGQVVYFRIIVLELEALAELLFEEVLDDLSSGTGQLNSDPGTEDTGITEQPKKRATRKKAGKKAR